jgi:hypothetical protein
VGIVLEKSITRQQAKRFRRANYEPSVPRSLARRCCGHKFLESRDKGELGYASLGSKSEILVSNVCVVGPWRDRSRYQR